MTSETICDREQCTGCGACVQICPKQCITMRMDSEGFRYPFVDEQRCVNCQKCVDVCHVLHTPTVHAATFYMAWHKDKDVLLHSSSGGVFTALATIVLRQGGVVFGATMDEDTREVYHAMVENEKELDKLRMSKYYQSDTRDVYQIVRAKLQEGHQVLFSGTACQVAALYRFLGDKVEWPKLITVDVLCHGVSSKKVVDAYISSKEKRYGKKIRSVRFRVKGNDGEWQSGGGTRMKLEFADDSIRIENKNTDTFFSGFNRNLFLRESCYRCKYCGQERVADFTIADFWGVNAEKVSEEQLRLGVSLMLVNTQKGLELVDALRQFMVITAIDPQDAIPWNQALVSPQVRPVERDRFFPMLEKMEYDRVIRRLLWKFYAMADLKSCLKKILGGKRYRALKKWFRKVRK